MLTAEQTEAFRATGIVRVPDAFDAEVALQIQERIWEHLEQNGVVRDEPATWLPERFGGFGGVRQQLPVGRLRTPRLRGAFDDLLGRSKWTFPERIGLLVSPPEMPQTPWKIARRDWHWDAGQAGPWSQKEGLFFWCVLGLIPPRSGGTLLLEGSRSLLGEFMAESEAQSVYSTRERFQEWHPYLRRLFGLDPADDPDEFLEPFVDEVGRRLRVMEVTGQPGDVIITEPGIVHRIPQHHGSSPRFLSLLRVAARWVPLRPSARVGAPSVAERLKPSA